ncbi:uncharacterized protein [Nerophis lumbriciformis]|uniref:uncharacterized protein n=1 Tax=Nerophis lumbriciformis TaxID=546530 RepID=UPI003BAB1CA4
MGPEPENIFKSFTLSEDDPKKFDVVLGKYDEYFYLKRNVIHERACFYQRGQRPGEKLEAGLTLTQTIQTVRQSEEVNAQVHQQQGEACTAVQEIARGPGCIESVYDTQLYMPLKLTNTPDCSQLEACLNEIKQWMSANFLQLNAKKMEMLIIGPARHRHLFNNTTLTFDKQTITQGDSVKHLGINFDPTLSFELHIKSVTKTAFFYLRNIAKICSILSTSDAEIIIYAFVTSRLDYCKVLFSGLPMSSIKRLQLVQNAAARLLTRIRKFDHITPILAHLHWLPVHLRCDFKVLLLTYKILHSLALAYLVDCIVPYVPARNLCSKNSGLLVIPRAQKKSAGYRAFSIRAPVLWNALPVTVRDASSVEAFKSHLKTNLYTLAFK